MFSWSCHLSMIGFCSFHSISFRLNWLRPAFESAPPTYISVSPQQYYHQGQRRGLDLWPNLTYSRPTDPFLIHLRTSPPPSVPHTTTLLERTPLWPLQLASQR